MSRDILESKHGECRSFVCSKYIGPFINVQRFSNVCNLKKFNRNTPIYTSVDYIGHDKHMSGILLSR